MSAYQQHFDRITAAHVDEPAILALDERIQVVDQVTADLLKRFESVKNASFDEGLMGVLDLPADTASARHEISALQIISQFQQVFDQTLSLATLDEQDLKVSRNYYSARVSAVACYIAEQGQQVALMSDGDGAEIVELVVAIPFFYFSNEQWLSQNVRLLLQWMHRIEYLQHLANFSLRVQRPVTAYQFSQSWARPADEKQVPYLDYLESAAEEMGNQREFHASLHCLRAGVNETRGQHDLEPAVEFRLMLAKLLN